MWQQVYDPLHSTVLSALVAAAPIILFLLSLTVFKLTGIKSALLSLAAALGIGIFVFGLPASAGAFDPLRFLSWHVAYWVDCAHGRVAVPH